MKILRFPRLRLELRIGKPYVSVPLPDPLFFMHTFTRTEAEYRCLECGDTLPISASEKGKIVISSVGNPHVIISRARYAELLEREIDAEVARRAQEAK